MNHVSKLIILLLLANMLASCASIEPKLASADGFLSQYPERIFLKPKQAGAEWITIERSENFVEVRVGAKSSRIPRNRKYQLLIGKLLGSEQWRNHAVKPYPSMPWSGPPRGILDVEYQGWGMQLQGSEVPDNWVAMITGYANDAQ